MHNKYYIKSTPLHPQAFKNKYKMLMNTLDMNENNTK